VRGALCLAALAFNASAIRRCVLLLASESVRALEWREQGDFTVVLGPARVALPATLAAGSFRLGVFLLLRLKTARGMRAVLIDGERQEIRGFRRLCRFVGLARRGLQAGGSGRSRELS
jgi:hypothetical protein